MNYKNVCKILASLIIICAVILPNFASAVTVGPVKLEYNVDPGTVITGEFYVKNEEEGTKTFYPSYEKFTEPNATKLFSKEQSAIALWVKTVPSVTLKSGEDKKIPFTITVPKDAPPGGHFAVVWWSTTPPSGEGSQVAIITRAGILVYLNVSGEVTGAATASAFTTAGGKKLFWNNPLPLLVSLRVDNNMNIYVKPQGDVRLTSLFGNIRSNVPLNGKNYQILPSSSRSIDGITFEDDGFMFGPYKISSDVSFSESAAAQPISFWIWVLPWKLLVTLILVVLIVVVGGPIFLKKYNNWVIAQARKGGNI
ncbi:MAG: hypothetical protein V4526_01355 [Patescibacteria group bacterium]